MSAEENISFQNMYREYLKYFSMNNDFQVNRSNLTKFKDYFMNYKEKKAHAIKEGGVLEDFEKVPCITEVDPEYYSIANSKIAWPQDSKSDMTEVKASSMLHLKTGFINDEILKAKHNFTLEMQLFKIMCQQHNRFVESFENFLIQDYENTESILQKSKEKTEALDAKINFCKELTMQIGTTKYKMDSLVRKCKSVDSYRTFLYQISPLSWLPQISGFEVYKDESDAWNTDHNNFVEMLKNKIDDEAQLPFTEPEQLKKLLENIESQNLTSWMNAEMRSENRENIKMHVNEIKENVNYEYKEVEELLQNVSKMIDWENMRSQELKQKIHRIIEGILRVTLCSNDYFKLNICLEDIFDRLIYKDISFKMQSLMTIIENEYETYVKKLDCINLESAKFAEKQRYKNDVILMEEARQAAKMLKMLESLNNTMKRSLA